jgi:hypothetical protein
VARYCHRLQAATANLLTEGTFEAQPLSTQTTKQQMATAMNALSFVDDNDIALEIQTDALSHNGVHDIVVGAENELRLVTQRP